MQNTKADLARRVLAALVDGVIASVVGLIPIIGALIGAAYMLTKDAVLFEVTKQAEWKNRSLGKKLFNLEVVAENGADVDLMTSVKRNVPLAIGTLLMIIPIAGWVLGPLVAFVFAIIEVALVLTEKNGKRLGDRWAGTQVVESVAAPAVGGGTSVDGD